MSHPTDTERADDLWLEEVDSDIALAWVSEHNAEAEATWFGTAEFDRIRASTLEVLEADDRIAFPMRRGDVVYNFWTDANHPRGILRRTTWNHYQAGEPDWELVLDVDALCDAENESWVFHGFEVLPAGGDRALIALSPGGGDASVTREFDLVSCEFVAADRDGFIRPLAKGSLTWIDADTVYVAHDFGPDSLTRSGYPRTIRKWTRGAALDAADLVFEGDPDDVAVAATVRRCGTVEHHIVERAPDFFTTNSSILHNGSFVVIDVPDDADVDVYNNWVFITPRSRYAHGASVFAPGSLVVADLDEFLSGTAAPVSLFEPSPTRALSGMALTPQRVVIEVLDDVRSTVLLATPPSVDDASWRVEPAVGVPAEWTVSTSAVDSATSNDLWMVGSDFTTPESLYINSAVGDSPPALLRQAPARFDATGLVTEQRFATSSDGTRIPYFIVGSTQALSSAATSRPTLLTAYGGFELPRVAAYSAVIGRSWLNDGGLYVLANIRGGGEYGPQWHRAGVRDQRPRVYEDFEAVARALLESGMTTPSQLGISGGSNGGLLVGNMYVRAPELFGAVVCQVPLLDMERYHLLLAGASWMAEYGDPDQPDDWAFLKTFSPYHLVQAEAHYPPMLLTTSTRDDRVHPGHARKMAALLERMGHDVTYWENIEGGHGGAADAGQQATMQALIWSFLRAQLGLAQPG